MFARGCSNAPRTNNAPKAPLQQAQQLQTALCPNQPQASRQTKPSPKQLTKLKLWAAMYFSLHKAATGLGQWAKLG